MPTSGFQVSRARVAPVMVKVEPSYGVDAAPTPGADDLLTFNSSIVWSLQATNFAFIPHGSSFTQRRDFLTARVAQARFRVRIMGSGAAGTVAVNGFAGLDAAMQGCAMTSTATPSTSIAYTPSTIAALKSVTIWAHHHGQVHKITGAWGNVVMTGNPRSGLEAEFTFTGLYIAPVPLGSLFNGFAGGEDRALPMLGIGLTIDNGASLTPVAQSFQFDRGVTLENVENMNDPNGIEQTLQIDAAPKMQVVIKQNNDGAAAIPYPQFFDDLFARTTHDVTFTLGSDAGNTITFDAAQAQLNVGTNPAQNGGHRDLTLQYKLQHDTNEGEFGWTIT